MTNQDDDPTIKERVSRVVDFHIPLTYLVSGLIFIGWVMISMWFSIGQMTKTLGDLQIAVNSGNVSVTAMSGELALLKFRLTNVEDSVKSLANKDKK